MLEAIYSVNCLSIRLLQQRGGGTWDDNGAGGVAYPIMAVAAQLRAGNALGISWAISSAMLREALVPTSLGMAFGSFVDVVHFGIHKIGAHYFVHREVVLEARSEGQLWWNVS